MDGAFFLELMKDVLLRCNEMLEAEPGLSIHSVTTKSVDERRIAFGGKEYYLKLSPESHNFLLDRLADVVVERISQISEDLARPSGAFWLGNWPVSNDVTRIAQDFCSDMRNQLVNDFRLIYGLDFSLIDSLSAHPYEKESCYGRMLFVSDPSADLAEHLTVKISAEKGIYLSEKNLKQIRKLLVGAGSKAGGAGNMLVFQRSMNEGSYEVKGYCQAENNSLSGWQICIQGVQEWSVGYNKTALFKFVRNIPQMIHDPVEDALHELVREFPQLDNNSCVKEQIKAADRQSHGTALIYVDFSNAAVAGWINNLLKYERALNVTMNDPGDLEKLSAMDGAVIVDVSKSADGGAADVVCVAAIVDGKAVNRGLLDRGARHNSIYTFVSNLAKETSPSPGTPSPGVVCALIFSEDGGITVFRGSKIKFELE